MKWKPGKYDFIGISYWWESGLYYPVYYSVTQQRPNPMIPNGHHEYLYEPHVRLVPMNKKVIGYSTLEYAQQIVEKWRVEAGLTKSHIDLTPKAWNGQAPHMRLRLLSDYNLNKYPPCIPDDTIKNNDNEYNNAITDPSTPLIEEITIFDNHVGNNLSTEDIITSAIDEINITEMACEKLEACLEEPPKKKRGRPRKNKN